MKHIECVEQYTETITTNTYRLLIGDPKRGVTYTWIDYLNQDGKVTDSVFRDAHGNEVSMDNPEFTDQVMAYIDDLVKQTGGSK